MNTDATPASPKSPMDILQAALRKEKGAYAFYDAMLNQSRVGLVSELVESLKNEEAKHVRMVEKRISELNLGRG